MLIHWRGKYVVNWSTYLGPVSPWMLWYHPHSPQRSFLSSNLDTSRRWVWLGLRERQLKKMSSSGETLWLELSRYSQPSLLGYLTPEPMYIQWKISFRWYFCECLYRMIHNKLIRFSVQQYSQSCLLLTWPIAGQCGAHVRRVETNESAVKCLD